MKVVCKLTVKHRWRFITHKANAHHNINVWLNCAAAAWSHFHWFNSMVFVGGVKCLIFHFYFISYFCGDHFERANTAFSHTPQCECTFFFLFHASVVETSFIKTSWKSGAHHLDQVKVRFKFNRFICITSGTDKPTAIPQLFSSGSMSRPALPPPLLTAVCSASVNVSRVLPLSSRSSCNDFCICDYDTERVQRRDFNSCRRQEARREFRQQRVVCCVGSAVRRRDEERTAEGGGFTTDTVE